MWWIFEMRKRIQNNGPIKLKGSKNYSKYSGIKSFHHINYNHFNKFYFKKDLSENSSEPSPNFNLEYFFKDNFQLLAIMGVIGSMISLSPMLGEKFLGANWIQNGNAPLALALMFLIFTGNLFILTIFYILIKKIYYNRNIEPDYAIFSKKIHIKMGDYHRIALLICLIPMSISISYFNLSILFYIPDKFCQLLASILILSFLYYTLIKFSVLFPDFFIIIFEVYQKGFINNIKYYKSPLFLITSLFLVSIIFLFTFFVTSNILSMIYPFDIYPENFDIKSPNQYYDPLNNQKVGVDLSIEWDYPFFQYFFYNTETKTEWSTNYGYFIKKVSNYEKSDFKIYDDSVLLKNSNVNMFSSHYWNSIIWNYPLKDIGKKKDDIIITVKLYNKNTLSILTEKNINLSWLNNDTLIIPIENIKYI